MPLGEILERNRTFLQGRTPQPLPPAESVAQLIVTCDDPRLDPLLRHAIRSDDAPAFLIPTAGAVVTPSGDPLRSIALAVYLFDVRAIAVVGHTSCRMAAFDTSRFIDAFRFRGVRRDGFGAEDLRQWAGAIPDPKRGVQASVAVLRAAPCLPRDLEIAGLVLDDTTGALEVVVKPDEALPGAVTSAPPAEPAREEPEPARAHDADVDRAAHAASEARPEAARGPAAAPAGAPDLTNLVAAARSFVQTAEAQAIWRYEVRRLRSELHAESNPIARLRSINAFVRKAIADSREVAAALDRLKHEAQGANVQFDEHLLLELLRRALMGET